jgi:lipopolysaccharide export system protein LptA
MNRLNSIATILLFSFWLTTLHAEENKQPISIAADQLTIDERKGKSTYQGNVVLTQGEIQITADNVTISSVKGEVNKISTTGNPAKFVRTGNTPLRAQSQEMIFLDNEGIIILKGSAQLWRQGDEFNSEEIRYYVDENRVEANSGDSSKGGGRVHVILQPQTGTK